MTKRRKKKKTKTFLLFLTIILIGGYFGYKYISKEKEKLFLEEINYDKYASI